MGTGVPDSSSISLPMHGYAYKLPVELLLSIFRHADPPTRVRASHVSRVWRRIALSDRRLWDSFVCSQFHSEQHQDAMFYQLQTMLRRSYSLPFRLRIPHRYHGGDTEYYRRLAGIEHLQMQRLALYEGPEGIFSRLVSDQTHLPALTTLNLISYSASPVLFQRALLIQGPISSHFLPNLHTLRAQFIRFPAQADPFRALLDLTCSAAYEIDFQGLFSLFPNIVQLRLDDINSRTVLPLIEFPESLRAVALLPARFEGLDIPTLLLHWAGLKLPPHIVMHQALSLRYVFALFLATHESCETELRLNRHKHEIEFVALSDKLVAAASWSITPWQATDAHMLAGLTIPGCQNLVSITVAEEQLGRFFTAQLNIPALRRLVFHLAGTPEGQLFRADRNLCIRAQHLQCVVFRMVDSIDDLDNVQRLLDVLCTSFLTLVIYNATLLNVITIPAKADRLAGAFAQYAKDVILADV